MAPFFFIVLGSGGNIDTRISKSLAVLEAIIACILLAFVLVTYDKPSGFGIGEFIRAVSAAVAVILALISFIAMKTKYSMWPHVALVILLIVVRYGGEDALWRVVIQSFID